MISSCVCLPAPFEQVLVLPWLFCVSCVSALVISGSVVSGYEPPSSTQAQRA